ncbi:MAG: TonB-dependent receptor domain-containing protein [Bryobacteraceae bacterium]
MRLRHYALMTAILLSVSAARAQESRGTIVGVVADPSGAAVAGAQVKAVNVDTNAGANSVTNDRGAYEIPYLLPGVYRITVESQGFKKATRDGIELRVADRMLLDFKLEVGDVAESVTVTGETPLLETSTASVGMIMNTRQLTELPTVGGSPWYLQRLAPGVMAIYTQGAAGNPMDLGQVTNNIVNGTRNASEATVDGAPNMSGRQAAFSPPGDLVQEVKVHTATFDASIGHAAGGLISVSMKSGTNAVHGTGIWSESQWRAVAWFTNNFIYNPATGPIEEKKRSVTDEWRHRRWGPTITAPLYIPGLYNGRDRTFWSFGYEGLYIRRIQAGLSGTGTYTVPSAAMKKGDFSGLLAVGANYQIYDPLTTVSAPNGRMQRTPFAGNIIPANRLDPIAQKLLGYYPDPNQAGTVDGRNNYFRPSHLERHNRTLVNRVDHNISERHRVFARWNNTQYDDTNTTLPTVANITKTDNTGWGLLLDDVYTFTPHLLLNLRYGITYYNPRAYRPTSGFDLTALGFPQSLVQQIAQYADLTSLAFPIISTDGYTQLGNGSGQTTKTLYHTWGGTLTRMASQHSVKMGAEFRLLRETGISYGNVAPQFNFGAAYTNGPLDNSPAAPIGQGMASLLLGIPTGGNAATNASRAEQSTYWGLFVQDDWRLTRRLTVNLGIRWEYEGPPTERFNRSIRGFDYDTQNPIAAQAKANYARSPIAEIPAGQFDVRGGLLFAGDRGQPRALWNPDRNNFSPRVGLAFQVNGKTVVRSGYGVFFDIVGIDRNAVRQGPFNATTNIIASVNSGLSFQASLANPFPNGISPALAGSRGLASYLGQGPSPFYSRTVNPYMQRWLFSLQRELPARTVVEVAYVGNRGTKLTATRQYSATPARYLSTLPERDQATINYMSQIVPNPFAGIPEVAGTTLGNTNISRANLLKTYPQFSSLTIDEPNGYSWYHSLQTSVEKRMSKGLVLQVAWTYSKFMQANAYKNATDPAPERIISDNDFPHRFVISSIYEFPFGRGRRFLSGGNGWVDAFLGGWQLEGWYEGQSGPALGFGNAIFRGDLHDIPLPVGQRRAQRWFNVDAGFERNNSRALQYNIQGLSNRFNDVRADGINNFNLSFMKNFRIGERFKLQYRFETFNSLNHMQFGAPNTGPVNSAFGTITAVNGHGARELNMVFKLLF